MSMGTSPETQTAERGADWYRELYREASSSRAWTPGQVSHRPQLTNVKVAKRGIGRGVTYGRPTAEPGVLKGRAMGWERGRYYTRSRKVNGRVVREYVGSGYVAELAAQLDGLDRDQRESEADARRA